MKIERVKLTVKQNSLSTAMGNLKFYLYVSSCLRLYLPKAKYQEPQSGTSLQSKVQIVSHNEFKHTH